MYIAVIFLTVQCFPINIFASTDYTFSNATYDAYEIEKAINDYYDMSYRIWDTLKMEDMSDVVNLYSERGYNIYALMQEAVWRWRYSYSKGYISGERECNRVNVKVNSITYDDDGAKVNVCVGDDKDQSCSKVYPYFVVLGNNTFYLIKKESRWLIDAHHLKMLDSIRGRRNLDFDVLTREMDCEYSPIFADDSSDVTRVEPHTDYSYNASRAVSYANSYVYSPNSGFYYVSSDDCTNFVSQCVLYGFGTSQTPYMMVWSNSYSSGWYAGTGGGSSSWENVVAHWNYITSYKSANTEGPRAYSVSISNIRAGDVVQFSWNSNGDYNHSAISIGGGSNPLLAQHSENGTRYLNDYPGTKRAYRASYFRDF